MIMMLDSIWVSSEVHGHEYKIKPCSGLRFSPAIFNCIGIDTEEMDRKIYPGCGFAKIVKGVRDKGTEITYKEEIIRNNHRN